MNENVSKKNDKKNTFIIELFESIASAFIFLIIITSFFFRICTVVGTSMNNTMQNGDRVLISNFAYTPKENDIIVFHQTGSLNEPIVKRVIATGDKWVKIDYDNALLYVSSDDIFDNSDIVDESEYIFLSGGHYRSYGTLVKYVPKGYLFVLGDNRNNSEDSRKASVGLVDVRTVLGRVIAELPDKK